jgi:autotransporter-associated beta strand protein
LAAGSWQHVAVTLNGNTATLYVNGAPVASSTSFSIAPSAFRPFKNYLGKSQFAADPLFNGKLDEVEIADYALTAAQISTLYHGAQNPSFISGVWTNDADGDWGDSNNWSNATIANGTSRLADFSTVNLTADRTVTLDGPRTIGGLRFGDPTGAQNWFLSGTSALTLEGGGANAPMIAVNQNTATISAPLAGTNGLVKNGNGALVLNAANHLGGGLVVNAGSVNLAGGTTTFGNGISSIGYLTGTGSLTMTAGSLATSGEFRVGGSDQSGAQYRATGMVTVADSTLSVGSLTVARGNYLDNSISGTLTLNDGGTLVSTNDAVIEFAGTGHGKLAINGGSFLVGPLATKWLVVGYWDSGAGELDITNGGLFLENSSSIKLVRGNNNTGANVINQAGGAVTFYSDAGATLGGGGNMDLNYAGGAGSSGTYNLDGGILTVPQVIASSSAGNSTFNFNGGTLKPAASSAAFMQGLTSVNLRNNGAKIDTAGFNVTIGQALLHSALAGDNATDGGLTKNCDGTLTLSGANTYTGPTTINAGTLALSGGGSIAGSLIISIGGGATLNVASGLILGAVHVLTGDGTVQGNLTVNGRLAPGSGIGVLTCNNNVTLQPGSTMVMELNSSLGTNDQLRVGGALAYAGTLHLTNLSGNLAGGETFKLFDAASSSGNFSAVNGSPGAGLDWKFDPASGVLTIYSTIPANLAFGVTNNALNISWPADHRGWTLQVQTNALNAGLGTNWVSVPGSAADTQFTAPLDAGNSSVFYRLIYQ